MSGRWRVGGSTIALGGELSVTLGGGCGCLGRVSTTHTSRMNCSRIARGCDRGAVSAGTGWKGKSIFWLETPTPSSQTP